MASSFSFSIPETDKVALKAISNLEDVQFENLVEAIRRTGPRLSPKGLLDQLESDSSMAFVSEELPSIVRVLANLSRGIYSGNWRLDEVTSSLAEMALKEELIEASSRDKLDQRLLNLFSLDVVRISSKANAILVSHPYVYGSAKIVTEIRPLFTDDEILTPPAASVIAHQLRFESFHNGDRSELFIALDDEDLVLLKEVIDRAIRKSKLLVEQEKQLGRTVVSQ
jgi:hypothetical protein